MVPQRAIGDEAVVYCGIYAMADALFEIDWGKVMVRIPNADVHGVTLEYGRLANHSTRQLIAGAVLTIIGGWPVIWLIDWLRHGGTIVDAALALIGSAVIGIWMIVQSL